MAQIENRQEVSYNTASGVLLAFGDRALLVTAAHVIVEYRTMRDAGRDVVVICDSMPLLPLRAVLLDEEADVAVLDVPQSGRRGLGTVPYRPLHMWPPPTVRVDDSVHLCGFPKLLREDGPQIVHGDYNLTTQVSSVGERYFMLNIDYDDLGSLGRTDLPRQQLNFGGISGGPVFLSDSEGSPLVGVVSQAGIDLPLWRIASLNWLPRDLGTLPSAPV